MEGLAPGAPSEARRHETPERREGWDYGSVEDTPKSPYGVWNFFKFYMQICTFWYFLPSILSPQFFYRGLCIDRQMPYLLQYLEICPSLPTLPNKQSARWYVIEFLYRSFIVLCLPASVPAEHIVPPSGPTKTLGGLWCGHLACRRDHRLSRIDRLIWVNEDEWSVTTCRAMLGHVPICHEKE